MRVQKEGCRYLQERQVEMGIHDNSQLIKGKLNWEKYLWTQQNFTKEMISSFISNNLSSIFGKYLFLPCTLLCWLISKASPVLSSNLLLNSYNCQLFISKSSSVCKHLDRIFCQVWQPIWVKMIFLHSSKI